MAASPDDVARHVLEVAPLIMRTLRSEMRQQRASDLSVPQFRTLSFLNRHPGASLSDVADHIGLTLPSMSKLVDGLVDRKLISRHTHAGDRRRVTLSLTSRGRSVWVASHQATLAYLITQMAALTEAQRATVVDAMEILRPLFSREPLRSYNGHSRN